MFAVVLLSSQQCVNALGSVFHAVRGGWMALERRVMAVNSLMVVYWLTSLNLLCQPQKRLWNCFWLVSRPHLGRLLDSPANLALTCCIWLIISFVAIILLQPGCLKQRIHSSFLRMFPPPRFCSLCQTHLGNYAYRFVCMTTTAHWGQPLYLYFIYVQIRFGWKKTWLYYNSIFTMFLLFLCTC